MLRSVRARTTLIAVAVVAATAVLAAILLVVLLHRSLLRAVDNRARLRLQDVTAFAARGELPATLSGSDEDGTVAQVVANQRAIAQSPIVQGTAPLAKFIPGPSGVTVRTVQRAPIPGSGAFRVAAQRVDTPTGPVTVYAAAGTEPVNDSMHAVEALLVVVLPALVLLVGGITYLLVGRTLRPVEAIRRRADEISARDLHQRVPEPGSGDEIDRLAHTMNTMLARLDDAAGRQRAFVSDAAHELRSPLASMRVELELARTRPDWAAMPATLARLDDTTNRMQHLVDDLLLLATTEEQPARRDTDVDLDDLVVRATEVLRATSGLTVDLRQVNAARVRGDRELLARVVANLVDNAEQHADTTVAIAVSQIDGIAELVVADDGPGIARSDRRRVFDRFARSDAARDRTQGGAGIGLAIVRRIVEEHGGSIAVTDAARGARVVVSLPAAASN